MFEFKNTSCNYLLVCEFTQHKSYLLPQEAVMLINRKKVDENR